MAEKAIEKDICLDAWILDVLGKKIQFSRCVEGQEELAQ